MPKRFSNSKRPKDVNQLMHHLVKVSTGQINEESALSPSDISKVMSEMGRKGGKIGGKRRLETMSPERRKEIALKAARVRWQKTHGKSKA
jgi:hypothetical protein